MHERKSKEDKFATLEEATEDILHPIGDYEWSMLPAKKNLKCLKCEKSLKGEDYYHQFNYPYINVKLWKLCEGCFYEIKPKK